MNPYHGALLSVNLIYVCKCLLRMYNISGYFLNDFRMVVDKFLPPHRYYVISALLLIDYRMFVDEFLRHYDNYDKYDIMTILTIFQ
jgi:hypothetical protein